MTTTTTSRTTPFHHLQQQRFLTTGHDDFAVCRKITWKDAFTDARALVSGIIMASLAIYPAIHFLRHYYNRLSCDNNDNGSPSSSSSSSSPISTTYGLDVSFPALQDVVQQEGNPLGNRHQVYLDYMEGCRRANDGDACDRYEHQRMLMNRRQPVSMEVS